MINMLFSLWINYAWRFVDLQKIRKDELANIMKNENVV